MLNELQVTAPPPGLSAEDLIAAADAAQADRAHRRVFVDDDTAGARLAGGVRAAGWRVDHDVYMALRGGPDRRGPAVAREASLDDLLVAKEQVARELAGPAQWPIIRAATVHVARATGARHFVADHEGRPASYATLYADGTVAQVEDVATVPAARGRGLARAVVQAAVDAAHGHELVFLCADGDDWPRELYARLGFAEIGWSWALVRLP